MSLSQEIKRFEQLCKKCQGKCCHISGHIPISLKEADFVKKKYPQVKIKIVKSNNGRIHCIDINEKCPFVRDTGCILNKNRFLNCKLFPIIFTYADKKIKFSLFNNRKYCPYIKQIQRLQEFQKYAENLALSELKTWTEAEKEYFSDLSEQIEQRQNL